MMGGGEGGSWEERRKEERSAIKDHEERRDGLVGGAVCSNGAVTLLRVFLLCGFRMKPIHNRIDIKVSTKTGTFAHREGGLASFVTFRVLFAERFLRPVSGIQTMSECHFNKFNAPSLWLWMPRGCKPSLLYSWLIATSLRGKSYALRCSRSRTRPPPSSPRWRTRRSLATKVFRKHVQVHPTVADGVRVVNSTARPRARLAVGKDIVDP